MENKENNFVDEKDRDDEDSIPLADDDPSAIIDDDDENDDSNFQRQQLEDAERRADRQSCVATVVFSVRLLHAVEFSK